MEHIVVLGHGQCGGILSLMDSQGLSNPNSFIDDWMSLVKSARASVMLDFPDATKEQRQRACEQRAILISLQNLQTFPWIKQRLEQGTLTLHGWYFDIQQGQLLGYDATIRQFVKL